MGTVRGASKPNDVVIRSSEDFAAVIVIPPAITLVVDGKMRTDATVGIEWQLLSPEPEPQELGPSSAAAGTSTR